MAFLIGTDEAGYGPNLGPLVVTGTLWQVPDDSVDQGSVDLYDLLRSSVTAEAGKSEPSRLHLADSKSVHKPSGTAGLRPLELPVLALLHSIDSQIPGDDRGMFRQLVSECVEDRISHFATEAGLWTPTEPFPLPVDTKIDDIRQGSKTVVDDCDANGVRLLRILCRPVFPAAFNHAVETLGNKATVLSATTLQIVRELLDRTRGSTFIQCDKHGGRSQYAALLQKYVTNQWITIQQETRACSCYRWDQPAEPCDPDEATSEPRPISISFSAKGESFLPVAVASMFSKYVREIYMEIWNEFWCNLKPDLKPTKGYPVDAKRFMEDIRPLRSSTSIPDRLIWRAR